AESVQPNMNASRFHSLCCLAGKRHCDRARHGLFVSILAVFGLLWALVPPSVLLAGDTPAVIQPTDRTQSPAVQPATTVPSLIEPRFIPKPQPGMVASYPTALRRPVPASLDDLKSIEVHVKALVARVSPAVVCVKI